MIAGIGLEVVAVAGFESADVRLRASEEAYCSRRADAAACRGARVAAKTALFRALGIAAEDGAPWADVEITRSGAGRPSFRIDGRVRSWCSERGIGGLHLSMTHTHDHAAAAVVVET